MIAMLRIRGITCPVCPNAIKMIVLKTMHPVAGRTVRYKKCPKCGCRMKTFEHKAPPSH